jgi:cysteine-rich repeat protein
MSKKLLTVVFSAALAVFTSAWLAGAAQAGPPSVCGDGNIEGDETCEDTPPNTTPGDGCDENCHLEVCGNGFVQAGTTPPEECDDGNTVDDDGCTAPDCQFDCGDGEIDTTTTPPETCEDTGPALGVNGDGCDDDPTTDPPGNCTATACGNGVVTAPEECDDGNTVDTDECNNACVAQVTLPQTKKQQGCINALNKNLAGVAKGQGSDAAKCLKDASKGGPTTCFVAGTKTGKAGGKTTKTFTGKKCTDEPPDFAATNDTTINGAGSDQVLEGIGAILGDPPTVAVSATDKPGAKCQAAAIKQYNKIVAKYLSEANKAKKTVLKGGKNDTPPQAENAGDVAAHIDSALTGNAAFAKVAEKTPSTIDKACQDVTDIGALFDCDDATTNLAVSTCIVTEATRAACEALEAADGIDLTCP